MKEYHYDKKMFAVHVVLSNAVMAVVAVVAALWAAVNPMPTQALLLLAALVAAYAAWNAFVSLSNPGHISVSDQELVFAAFGREHRYRLDELTFFNVRQVGGNNKMFLRVNRAGLLRGRYWVDVFYFSDAQALAQTLLELERKVHPDSLKEIARKGQPLNPNKKK